MSEGSFDLFGLPMASGRSFTTEDYAAAPRSRVVLSARAWRATFGSDSLIVGKTIQFAGGSALVVGVAPNTFAIPREADLWFAQHNSDSIGHAFDAYVRFRPGLTPAAIQGPLPSKSLSPRRTLSPQRKDPYGSAFSAFSAVRGFWVGAST